MSATKLVTNWWDFLPQAQQNVYRPFVLPALNPFLAEEFSPMEKAWVSQQQTHRKAETEAVVPAFTALRAEAHFRFNRLQRLWQAYQQAVKQVLPDHSNLPLTFSYEEGDPPVERPSVSNMGSTKFCAVSRTYPSLLQNRRKACV